MLDNNIIYTTIDEFCNIVEDISQIYSLPDCCHDDMLSSMFNLIFVELSENCKDGNVNDIITFFNFIINDFNNFRIQVDTNSNRIVFNGVSSEDLEIEKKKLYLIYLYVIEAILYKKSIIKVYLDSYLLSKHYEDTLINFFKNNLSIKFFIIKDTLDEK